MRHKHVPPTWRAEERSHCSGITGERVPVPAEAATVSVAAVAAAGVGLSFLDSALLAPASWEASAVSELAVAPSLHGAGSAWSLRPAVLLVDKVQGPLILVGEGWVAKSVARQFATAVLWVRIHTSLENHKWET
jgi:hypothetical protein